MTSQIMESYRVALSFGASRFVQMYARSVKNRYVGSKCQTCLKTRLLFTKRLENLMINDTSVKILILCHRLSRYLLEFLE